MRTTVKFTIVIPTYNYESVIIRSVRSVLSQSGQDYEVIVVNDGSTDNTDEIMRRYINNNDYRALRYHMQSNGGTSSARNKGVELSRGDYLIFLDADDEMAEGALNHIRVAVKKHPQAGLLVGGHITVLENGSEKIHKAKLLKKSRVKNFYNYLAKKITIQNGSAVMNKNVFNTIRYPDDLVQSEDIPVFGQAFAIFDCYSIDAILARIHRHEGSRRSDINLARRAGFDVVEHLFDSSILPLSCMKYRNYFYAKKCLSLFRTFYNAGIREDAKKYYFQGFMRRPFMALKLTYLRKYVRLLLKRY